MKLRILHVNGIYLNSTEFETLRWAWDFKNVIKIYLSIRFVHLHLINRIFLQSGVFISKKVSKFSAPFNKLFTFDIDVINCYFPTFNRPFVATIFMNFPFAMTIQLKPRIELEKFRLATTTHFLIDISSPHLFVMYLSYIATLSCFFFFAKLQMPKTIKLFIHWQYLAIFYAS